MPYLALTRAAEAEGSRRLTTEGRDNVALEREGHPAGGSESQFRCCFPLLLAVPCQAS